MENKIICMTVLSEKTINYNNLNYNNLQFSYQANKQGDRNLSRQRLRDIIKQKEVPMNGQYILVPVDGSPHSIRAAEYAIRLALCMKKEILLIHFHKHFPSLIQEPYYQRAVTKTLSQSNALLEPFRQMMAQAGINFEGRILEGPPGDRICEVARLEKCEMIVMGSRGRTELQGLILGSVAHRVLHSAACPVLVVK